MRVMVFIFWSAMICHYFVLVFFVFWEHRLKSGKYCFAILEHSLASLPEKESSILNMTLRQLISTRLNWFSFWSCWINWLIRYPVFFGRLIRQRSYVLNYSYVTNLHTKKHTAGLPISLTWGRCWNTVITRSDFKSEAIFGFLSPNYIVKSTCFFSGGF